MPADPSHVIVTSGAGPGAASVHHRKFPEIHAEGQTPAEAAGHLVNALTLALDTALTDWRRQAIEGALADVRAFLTQV